MKLLKIILLSWIAILLAITSGSALASGETALTLSGMGVTDLTLNDLSTGTVSQMVIGGSPGLALGADGNFWTLFRDRITRVTPDGTVTTFDTPRDIYMDPKAITSGPDGNIWIDAESGSITAEAVIARVTPTGKVTMFTYDAGDDVQLSWITAGRDGNLWAVGTLFYPGFSFRNIIVRITPSGVITRIYTGPYITQLRHTISMIKSGPDGNLWFSMGNAIGRITPGGVITQYASPVDTDDFFLIATDSKGNLWATGKTVAVVGGTSVIMLRITPDGSVTRFLSTIPYYDSLNSFGLWVFSI